MVTSSSTVRRSASWLISTASTRAPSRSTSSISGPGLDPAGSWTTSRLVSVRNRAVAWCARIRSGQSEISTTAVVITAPP
jgi:hypothetical protein